MIRAVATGGGSGGTCSGPVVPWLGASAATTSIDGGANTTLQVVADSAVGALGEGEYHAEICLVTNDPQQAVLAIPVHLVVGHPPAAACSGGADTVFCDGFESSANPNLVGGTIGAAVADSADGSSFDFATADYHGYDAGITSDDVNLYDLAGGPDGDGMRIIAIACCWFSGARPGARRCTSAPVHSWIAAHASSDTPIASVNSVFAPRQASAPVRPSRLFTKRGTKATVITVVSRFGSISGSE